MTGYEWLPEPKPEAHECDECGHVTWRMPEPPYFGPVTLREHEFNEMYRKIYAEIDYSKLSASQIDLLALVRE